MAIGADIIVRIATNASDAARDVDQAASKYGKFGAAMESMVAPATIAIGAIAAFGKQATDAASSTEQAMGAVDSVFGASADTVKAWAASAAQAVGLSESSYGQLASVAGASLKSMGLDQAAAADQTGKLITLGADLAATFGGTTAEAVGALTSALRGEADPAERLGLKLNQATVAARMAADGTDKLTGTALESAKAQTIMALAAEQAAGANGQFARESDTASGSAQIAAAEYENTKAALGEQLLPALTAVTQALSTFTQWVSENVGLVTTLVGIVGGLAAAVLAVNAAMALANAATAVWNGLQLAWKGITAAATAVQWAWNAAMAANPVGLIILAIAALIAIIVLVVMNWEWFRDQFLAICEIVGKAAEAAWNWIKDAAGVAWDWIVGKVTEATDAIKAVIGAVADWIKSAWDAVATFVLDLWAKIKSGAETVWNAIKSVVETVMGGIRSVIDGALSFIIGLWDKLKQAGETCWNAIKSVAQAVITPFTAVRDAIQWVIDKLKTAWEWAQKVLSKIPFIGGMVGASSSSAVAYSTPGYATPSAATSRGLASGLGRSTRAISAGGAGVQIVVQGALDPVGVANQIERILRDQGRRTRGVVI